jgi:dipeptidyl-peptidase-3
MNHVILATSLSLLTGLCACSGAQVTGAPSHEDLVDPYAGRQVILGEEGRVTLLQLYADGFEALPLKDRVLAFHLYQAAVAGRDIAWDQTHRHSLTIRRLLGAVLSHPRGVAPETLDRIRRYARLLWLNNGPYYTRTKDRFLPGFDRQELIDALAVAQGNGAPLAGAGADLASVERFLFDPEVEPLSTNKNPPPGGDILLDSGNNYYSGVSMADLERFEEQYPLNSRLVKREEGLEEEVLRAGRPLGDGWEIPPGRHGATLGAVIGHLEAAAAVADGRQRDYLLLLIEYYRTGDPTAFDEASIAWLDADPEVDVIHGFIETYLDARGAKGEYEGLVTYRNPEATRVLRVLAENAQRLEDAAPWKSKYRKTWGRVPVANAVNVLVGVGHAGPNVPLGINLPNSQAIREEHGSKSVFLVNVMDGVRAALSDRALEAFVPPAERDAVRRYRRRIGQVMVALHEVVGHGSGKVSAALSGDPSDHLKETYAAIEETRAELVALHHVFDPLLVTTGLLPDAAAAEVALRGYLRGDLLQLRRVETGDRFDDDHMRATHLIAEYLTRRCGCVEMQVIDGAHFPIITDVDKARKGVATLLAEVMRIKAEGDYGAARELVDTYAIRFDPALRDEVVARAKAAGIPQFYAFHMPGIVATRDASGAITDVQLEYREDFDAMMQRWDGETP